MKKQTVRASSDVALIKYWGKKDEILRLPENGSVSIVLDGLDTITTVEFDENLSEDSIIIEGKSNVSECKRVSEHLDRIRKLAGVNTFARVMSENTFPKSTGLSSSGSGFAALTLATLAALEIELSPKEASILARQGSGTACRCVLGGFVEWKNGDTSDSSYSETIFNEDYWDIRDVVAVVDYEAKKISSSEGHKAAQSSPFYETRLKNISQKIELIKQYIKQRDFSAFGKLVEAEALEFHTILLTSTPSLMTWYPGTIAIMNAVKEMRAQGIEAYFTINTGFNVHVLTLPQYVHEVEKRLLEVTFTRRIIHSRVGKAPQKIDSHLF